MRSYHQYCGVAKALDVIGDRWTLLIIRELLIRERCRYTDLLDGLPGIATNLLAERLQELERAGIVSRHAAAPPIATTLFELTSRGKELEHVVQAIGRWGGPLTTKRSSKDRFRSHWMALPAELHLKDHAPARRPITIELRCGDEPMVIEAGGGHVRIREGSAQKPNLVLTGRPEVIVALMTRRMSADAARAAGVRFQGDVRVLRRVLPRT